jgi:ABC-type ATPase involved in cell division
MTHQMQAKGRELALAADRGVGQPDRGHQIAPRQLASTLASMRSVLQASGARPLTFCASAINTSQPCSSSVSCTNRAVHRLDHRAYPPTRRPIGQTAQAIGVRRHRRLGDHLAARVEQTDIEPTSTQIQSSVQIVGLLELALR